MRGCDVIALDALAVSALRALCGADLSARIAWSRMGVEISISRGTSLVGISRQEGFADAVLAHAIILGRDDIAGELLAARDRAARAETMRPTAPGGEA